MCVNHGMFFEFVPVDDFLSESYKRISLSDVVLGVNYVVILNTDAGLWGYNIGDTVSLFLSTHIELLLPEGLNISLLHLENM